jgi:hypothetical protein
LQVLLLQEQEGADVWNKKTSKFYCFKMKIPETTPWCEKYRASCFADVKGQDLAIDKVKVFLRSFPQKKRVLL